MKQIKLYYVVSDVFGELSVEADDLDEAIDKVQDEWANSGDIKLIERTYILKEERQHVINTDY